MVEYVGVERQESWKRDKESKQVKYWGLDCSESVQNNYLVYFLEINISSRFIYRLRWLWKLRWQWTSWVGLMPGLTTMIYARSTKRFFSILQKSTFTFFKWRLSCEPRLKRWGKSTTSKLFLRMSQVLTFPRNTTESGWRTILELKYLLSPNPSATAKLPKYYTFDGEIFNELKF